MTHDRAGASGEEQGPGRSSERNNRREKQLSSERSRSLSLRGAMRRASEQLAELLGCEAASISAVKAVDGGWVADVEVVEVERIPETSSVMGSYRVELDAKGRLTGYERKRRYARGQIDRRP